MHLQVIQILDLDNPDLLESLVGLTWKGTLNDANQNNSFIICQKKDIDDKLKWSYSKVRDGIYVMTGGSAHRNMHVLKQIIEAYKVPKDEFYLSVKVKEI